MSQPLPDGFNFSDAFWLAYDAGMMGVLLIVLGLILAETVVFFISSCLSCLPFGNRQRRPPQAAAHPLAAWLGSARRVQGASTPETLKIWNAQPVRDSNQEAA